MPTQDPPQRFRDIIENIDLIIEFTHGLSREAFDQDIKTRLAAERCLQINTEAAAKLGSIAEDLAPHIPWANIRGMGNRLRHGYGELNAEMIWSTMETELPPLRVACETAIRRLDDDT